ncbi:MAG: Ribosomal large subunit pseudouridine synthase D [Planctomycetes bacterium]|nr:Ribosomal large subunit pseudouridine synthase D [Planctomycetota bacterium]
MKERRSRGSPHRAREAGPGDGAPEGARDLSAAAEGADEPLLDEGDAPVHRFTVADDEAGPRLDVYLAAKLPDHSRTWLSRHVDEGHLDLVREGRPRKAKPGLRVEPGDELTLRLLPRDLPYAAPEKIPLRILHEDEGLVVIDKPPGLTVHPGSGEKSGTLANALAWHFGELSSVQGPMRPGIVHRLDKDTSGVMVVAKDDTTHWALSHQFRERTVRKEYRAVCRGVCDLDADLISAPLGPDRMRSTRMAVRMDIGRPSETYYQVLERYAAHTYVRCLPKTGRTHQIRVHMASVGHPLVSDRVYGGYVPALAEVCPRQALHAFRLEFTHPATNERVAFEAPIPEDFERLLAHLRAE